MAGITYISTGKGKYLNKKGVVVNVNGNTADYLVKNGFIIDSESITHTQAEENIDTDDKPKRGRKPKQ